MSKTKTNTHERQSMWCDGCHKANILPLDDYTQMGGLNYCQDCEPIPQRETAKAGALR